MILPQWIDRGLCQRLVTPILTSVVSGEYRDNTFRAISSMAFSSSYPMPEYSVKGEHGFSLTQEKSDDRFSSHIPPNDMIFPPQLKFEPTNELTKCGSWNTAFV